jgi:hypothetical protein
MKYERLDVGVEKLEAAEYKKKQDYVIKTANARDVPPMSPGTPPWDIASLPSGRAKRSSGRRTVSARPVRYTRSMS